MLRHLIGKMIILVWRMQNCWQQRGHGVEVFEIIPQPSRIETIQEAEQIKKSTEI